MMLAYKRSTRLMYAVSQMVAHPFLIWRHWQVYSNGVSEIILGKAIKKFNFPRDEIVVMTKASFFHEYEHF